MAEGQNMPHNLCVTPIYAHETQRFGVERQAIPSTRIAEAEMDSGETVVIRIWADGNISFLWGENTSEVYTMTVADLASGVVAFAEDRQKIGEN